MNDYFVNGQTGHCALIQLKVKVKIAFISAGQSDSVKPVFHWSHTLCNYSAPASKGKKFCLVLTQETQVYATQLWHITHVVG